MNTLDELIDYCKETDPAGALLLTGEWGCGKTYLIDHQLRDKLKGKAHIILVSLFGMQNIEELHSAIKLEWANEASSEIGFNKSILKKTDSRVKIIAKLDFLPDWVKGFGSTDWLSFVRVKNMIDEKPVILVFDDLERCGIDIADVLGVINYYCESKKFHIIIVANESKILSSNRLNTFTALVEETEDKNDVKPHKLKIQFCGLQNEPNFPYNSIKEKIIQRTLEYRPDYREIVQSVIKEIKFRNHEYEKFIKLCESGIFELFSLDGEECASTDKTKKIHNIRSLKCAILDYYRVYQVLLSNGFDELEKWFYNFTVYVLAYKAGFVKEAENEPASSYGEIRNIYPTFQSSYMLKSVENWVLHGIWNDEEIQREVELIKESKKATLPRDIVRTRRILDVDDDVFKEGFSEFLEMAYSGQISLDDYIRLITNSYWARRYSVVFPRDIEWDKVQNGIKVKIEHLLAEAVEIPHTRSFINEKDRELFSDEEWDTYEIIDGFYRNDVQMFGNNKKMYIEGLKSDALTTLNICMNKRFHAFDAQMAEVTAEAFSKGNNSYKHEFWQLFENLWIRNVASPDINRIESIAGFNILRGLLSGQIRETSADGKQIALRHVQAFVGAVDSLILKYTGEGSESKI